MSDQRVKGSILKSRLAFVETQFGREGLEKVLASLDDEDRQALQRVVPVAWLDFDIGRRLDDAIVKVLGGGRTEVFERLGLRPEPNLENARCGECNGELVDASRGDVAEVTPPHVLATASRFRRCDGCHRVYWPGSHGERILERMATIVASLDE